MRHLRSFFNSFFLWRCGNPIPPNQLNPNGGRGTQNRSFMLTIECQNSEQASKIWRTGEGLDHNPKNPFFRCHKCNLISCLFKLAPGCLRRRSGPALAATACPPMPLLSDPRLFICAKVCQYSGSKIGNCLPKMQINNNLLISRALNFCAWGKYTYFHECKCVHVCKYA